ncbi:PTS mannose/fructose/sorbose transporter subunit IIC [Lactiplantibacillus garii]|uniref:PTS mannose/fructose/sorbose transporter subunit IIC n=1 Tax=Lactiplantibacillus garii TaxID=2306423 RepID=A0A3R8J741_9LACO|nr:PTS mannose/fructose/sorbose transporter subunit IIC [Lactiplantibacillus garii]RRK10091.1 PTS mannose/fructose/sorbose transporter subunit IIC [Lactiplantibacillus garii]
MNAFQAILVLIVAFIAGCGSVLDEAQFHRPLVACTLIGLVLGHLSTGLVLGSSLELIALGWMNVGAAMAPDAALASVISAVMVINSGLSVKEGIAIAIPLAVAGQVLTILVRTITAFFEHQADKFAENDNPRGIEFLQLTGLVLQGLRIAIPTALVLLVSPKVVQQGLEAVPKVITNGLAVAGGFIVVVGYAMVINMMATRYLMPFFFLGFLLAAVSQLNLIALGLMGLCIAIVYIQLAPKYHNGGHGGSDKAGKTEDLDDELEKELDDF